MLYLDHAATTPVHPAVREAMLPWLGGSFGNPSSHHTIGEAAAEALEDARTRVARALGRRRGEVVFTSGGTEGNNAGVKGIVLAALGSGRRHLVTTPIEHESVLASADFLRRFHGVEISLAEVDPQGRVRPEALAAAIREDTALVALAHANNEIGTVQDVPALAEVAHARGVPLHLDAVQSAGWLGLAGTGADAIAIAGHKIGAAPGTGALAVRTRVPLEPLLHGGGQERGRRSGTENVAGAVGLALALELAEREREESAARVAAQRDAFIAEVQRLLPQARLTGDPVHRLPGSASFTLDGTSGEAVLLELERRGVVSSSGSACAAGSDEPSHVLVACGVPREVAQTAIRFTLPHSWGAVPGGEAMLMSVATALAAAVAAVAG